MKDLKNDVVRILNQNSFDGDYLCWRVVPYGEFTHQQLLDNLQKKYQRSMFPTTILAHDGYVWINLYYLQDIAWRYGYFITNKEGDPMQRLMSIVIDEVQTKATTWLKLDINMNSSDLRDLYDSAEIYKFKSPDDPISITQMDADEAINAAITRINNM